MVVSFRKAVFFLVLVLILLIALMSWSIRTHAAPVHPQTHSLAIECPPPPYSCR